MNCFLLFLAITVVFFFVVIFQKPSMDKENILLILTFGAVEFFGYYIRSVSSAEQVMMSMADIIEGRDNNTGGHVKRTSAIVKLLAGEDIPLAARIMAIADVYDALVSKRCYKDAMTFEKANSIMEESFGSHFDPSLKKYFDECLPTIESFYLQ